MENQQEVIIFKEKYGSFNKERYYVQPSDQVCVVVHKDEKFGGAVSLFRKIFLPPGYPHSVSNDYIGYQKWDTAQAFCSTVTGILATQEVLRGVGVGDTNATPLAATVTWVFKDGCGHLGRILFAYTHGSYLDAYSKKWRIYADILNDAAMCIEMALPLFSNYITLALCASTIMKAIVGVAGGATRVAMTQHHALIGNFADVSAKDSAQETAVNFVASVTALFILYVFGNALFIFALTLILHIVFNYFAVRAVCLRTLNVPRYLQVIDTYFREEVIENPSVINKNEPIVYYQLGNKSLEENICGLRIELGKSISQIIGKSSTAEYLKTIKDIYDKRKYILFPNTKKRIMYVFIKNHANVDDVLCAYFHAVLLSIATSLIHSHKMPLSSSITLPNKRKNFESPTWRQLTSDRVFNFEPLYDLYRYVNSVATEEWETLKEGLLATGWDLSKHLLIMDEWRINSEY